MESFIQLIRTETNLPKDQLEQIEKSIITKHIRKKTILQHQGQAFNKAFFVKKGCLRSYIIDKKGKEHIFNFAPEGWIVSDFTSVVYNQVSDFFVDAIEDSIIEVIERPILDADNLSSFHMNNKGAEKLMRRIAVLQKRVLLLLSASAAERYEDFTKTYPSIVQRAPQWMIASYLGITPQALSTIRGRKSGVLKV